MSRLLDAIREDPDAVFAFEADLPSGNRMSGTIGPVVNGKILSHVTFRDNPPSAEDIRITKETLNRAMGLAPVFTGITDSREEASAIVRRFMGGGQG